MTDDFALLDFLLLKASLPDVAAALVKRSGQVTDATDADPAAKGALLSRFFGKVSGSDGPSDLLLAQPASADIDGPVARSQIGDTGAAHPLYRLSAPIGRNELTLLEFIETEIGQSSVARDLSAAFPGLEVYYFRYSGTRHPGAEFAFHIYQDGRALRRAASLSFRGVTPEAQWSATDSGMPHPVEADSLPAPETPQAEIMTPDRQGSILTALGVEPDALFGESREKVLLLSSAPGGAPYSAGAVQTNPAPQPVPVAPPTPEIVEPVPEPEPEQVVPMTNQEPAVSAPAPEITAPAPVAPEAPAIAVSSPAEWEQAVTKLLLEAVDAGLPDGEQVTWLTTLTEQLEAGHVEAALESAVTLIARGERPEPVKTKAAQDLKALYAHLVTE